MVQGEVHAKFGPDPFSSLGGEWRQTNKQTDTPFCYIYIDFVDVFLKDEPTTTVLASSLPPPSRKKENIASVCQGKKTLLEQEGNN